MFLILRSPKNKEDNSLLNTLISKNIKKEQYFNKIVNELSSYYLVLNTKDDSKKMFVKDNYFLREDTWKFDEIVEMFQLTSQFPNYKDNKIIRFNLQSPTMQLEVKYVFHQQILNFKWKLSTAFIRNNRCARLLMDFINDKYPRALSILELDIERIDSEWRLWLSAKGIPTLRTVYDSLYRKDRTVDSQEAKYFLFFRNLLFDISDSREEWEKDKWYIENLSSKYGFKYSKSKSTTALDFTKIHNIPIREEFKLYIKHRLMSKNRFSWSSANGYLGTISIFLNYICKIEPTWKDLNQLNRGHIINYLEYLHKYAHKIEVKNSNPEHHMSQAIILIQKFLEDIQRYEYKMAPKKPVKTLFFNEDKPKLRKKGYDQIDHIPDHVLEQLFQHLSKLSKESQAIIWIAFKTGLRISDVLGLKQDCLIKLNDKYQVVTDIEKTYVQGHSIPIDDNLAAIIASLIDDSIRNSNTVNNPDKYVFAVYSGKRKGKPISRQKVSKDLNILAYENNITDESGNLWHFKTHQFRHTYAVKMLNGGADILTVQELLAHASPEMTMRYAKLLDNTKRKAFESAVKQGVFSFDINGKVCEITDTEEVPQDILDMLWRDQKLTAIDNPYGSCRARLNGNCPYAEEPPCLTCNGGKPCKDLAVGISDMDVAKYELHIQSTSKMIEVAKQYGRKEIAEKNEKNLERLKDIYYTIKNGNILFGRIDRVKRKQGAINDRV
jgi:integrase